MTEQTKNKRPQHAELQVSDKEMLDDLRSETFNYFLEQVDPVTGLIADKTQPGSPSSIAATGMGITAYIVGVERKLMTREDAIHRVLKVLRFFHKSRQGKETDATGYKGFYYHFLDMSTGKRVWESELSTVDTAFLIAGMLAAASYFRADTKEEIEIRELADALYRRVDWEWALNGQTFLSHGWVPESGFLVYHWDYGYSEAHLMYMLAIASPAHPISADVYPAWIATFKQMDLYDINYIHAGPLFIHQFSHMWIDFRGIYDDLNRMIDLDYFENSHRATCIQQKYAIHNPKGFSHYGANCWGLTASDGPGDEVIKIGDREITFYDYIARAVPYGPDDGTVAPWAVVASLPFAPEIVIGTIRHAIEKLQLKDHVVQGFEASFNPTHPDRSRNPHGWVSEWRFGLNQGPIVVMIENFQTGLIWRVMKACPYIISGLKKAGFTGGWLEGSEHDGK